MHICQDEVNQILMVIPFVGIGLAWSRSKLLHAYSHVKNFAKECGKVFIQGFSK